MEDIKFGFEDLAVWQKAVEFARVVIQLTAKIETDRKHYRFIENCESASCSVAANIAEARDAFPRRSLSSFSILREVLYLKQSHHSSYLNAINGSIIMNFKK